MLSATETVRVQKFTAEMDAETASAMFSLFELTKPGCDQSAYELMSAAHGHIERVSEAAVRKYEPHGIVLPNGLVPDGIKKAVRKAVAENYLVMHGPENPALKPQPRYK